MIKENQKIVTKRRYSGMKALIIVTLFTVELFFMFKGYFTGNNKAIFALASYCLLSFSYIGKMNSSKLYLKYEYLLGVIIKSFVINLITGFALIALLPNVSVLTVVWRICVLAVANMITVMFVFVGMNIYMKVTARKSNVLHIYPEIFDKSGRKLEEIVEQTKREIDQYEYIYLHNLSSRIRKKLLKYCYEYNKVVYCSVNLSDVILRTAGLTQDVDSPVYYCTSFGIGGISAVIKRAFDIVFSLIMIILTSPIMLITAICIKLEDRGSIIYKQVRCTKDMKEFVIYKFRSMKENSEGSTAKFAVSDDERLTKVGKVIRKFKIDEFPQFFNILKGDMSVVGPRPERPEMVKQAIKKTPEFVLRTKVKAGLTGYAQVRGYYNTGFKDKLLWDLIYIETFSLILDLKIILMTIVAVFSENIRDE